MVEHAVEAIQDPVVVARIKALRAESERQRQERAERRALYETAQASIVNDFLPGTCFDGGDIPASVDCEPVTLKRLPPNPDFLLEEGHTRQYGDLDFTYRLGDGHSPYHF